MRGFDPLILRDMKRYKIIKRITLDFLTPQDQVTCWIHENEGFVEWDEKNTVWWITESNERKETRGKHIRTDYPFTNPLFSKLLVLKDKDGEPEMEWRPIKR